MPTTRYEDFILENGEALAQNFAYHSIAAVKEVLQTLSPRGAVPAGADLSSAALMVMGLRAAIDLATVATRFGPRARDLLIDALDRYYADGGLVTIPGGFKMQVTAASQTIMRTSDPRDWVRAHSVAMLDSRDPEDEVFHVAVQKCMTAAPSMADEIAERA